MQAVKEKVNESVLGGRLWLPKRMNSEKFQSPRPPFNGSVLGGRLFSVEVAGRVVAAVGGRASI